MEHLSLRYLVKNDELVWKMTPHSSNPNISLRCFWSVGANPGRNFGPILMGMVSFCSEFIFLGNVRGTFFDFCLFFSKKGFFWQKKLFFEFLENAKVWKAVIWMQTRNQKKYHGHYLKNVFLNKMPPVPSKSVKNYDLS